VEQHGGLQRQQVRKHLRAALGYFRLIRISHKERFIPDELKAMSKRVSRECVFVF
jgi:hypothetical protein